MWVFGGGSQRATSCSWKIRIQLILLYHSQRLGRWSKLLTLKQNYLQLVKLILWDAYLYVSLSQEAIKLIFKMTIDHTYNWLRRLLFRSCPFSSFFPVLDKELWKKSESHSVIHDTVLILHKYNFQKICCSHSSAVFEDFFGVSLCQNISKKSGCFCICTLLFLYDLPYRHLNLMSWFRTWVISL